MNKGAAKAHFSGETGGISLETLLCRIPYTQSNTDQHNYNKNFMMSESERNFYGRTVMSTYLIRFRLPSPLMRRVPIRATASAREKARRKFSPNTLRMSVSL